MKSIFEPLNAEKILCYIDSPHRSTLTRLEVFNTLDSTNQYLLDHAKDGTSGWVCLAEQQTAGRGRRGRQWFSEPGSSILCSLLWRFPSELLDVSSLSLVIGVMLLRALQNYGIQTGIQLKWPNDILFAERKFVGILIERRGENIVIGFGLNVDVSRLLEQNYIDLSEIVGRPVHERNKITGLILTEILKGLLSYPAEGLLPYMDEWKQHDYLAGKKVSISTSEKIIVGIAQGINAQGELLVLDEDQALQHFCYGEVSVRQVSP